MATKIKPVQPTEIKDKKIAREVMDAIKLSFSKKELHNLKYPFKTIAAMKIAKLVS
jgi:hypothetical protein